MTDRPRTLSLSLILFAGLGLLLGSTANAVLHGVGCDVLVVKIHPQE